MAAYNLKMKLCSLLLIAIPVFAPLMLWIYINPTTFIEKIIMLIIHLILTIIIFLSELFIHQLYRRIK